MLVKTCQQCKAELVRRDNEAHTAFAARKFCSKACKADSMRTPTPPKKCELCGTTFTRKAGEKAYVFNKRRFCSKACGGNGGRFVYVVGEVEHLLDYGTEATERIAERLGYTGRDGVGTIIRACERLGRYDLSARLRDRSYLTYAERMGVA